MAISHSDDEVWKKNREVAGRFYLPSSPDDELTQISTAVSEMPSPYNLIAQAFQHNLAALISTVSFPFSMAVASIQSDHYRRFHAYEAILLARVGEPNDTPEKNAKIHELAEEKWNQFVKSKDGVNTLASDTWDFLLGALGPGKLDRPASELLLQGIVLAWGAFEVLTREVVVAFLNENPVAIEQVASDPNARKRFDVSKMPLGVLSEYGFDLSHNMGTVFGQQQDFSNLSAIKAITSALFPGANELALALGEKEMWMLSQQRHLVVHRRGVIDEKYLASAGTKDRVGSQLQIDPSLLTSYISIVKNAGIALLRAASTKHV
jgi:hypothetical protein